MKLDAAERFLSSQEKERLQSQRESDRLHDQTRQRLQLEEVGGAQGEDLPGPRA